MSDTPVTSSGIRFNSLMGSRRLRSLDKDHLQTEEEENNVQMQKKMFQVVGSRVWRCRDCDWSGPYRHKAKGHARTCGQRKRASKRKYKEKKYECSNGECGLAFALRSKLLNHYRYCY